MPREEIITLLRERQILEQQLSSLVYGAIEIRVNGKTRSIYVHYRERGRLVTRYVGKYSDELHQVIINNNIKARGLKKQINTLTKQIKKLGGNTNNTLPSAVQNNIDFAHRHLADSIYKQAVLEGVATTYPDTENIINGGKTANMTSDDVLKIVNLKHAWDFVLDPTVIQSPTDFSLVCQINKIIEEGFYYNAGRLRGIPVAIHGTTWQPDLPIESTIKAELARILNTHQSIIEIAAELLAYTTKAQIFIDGNKRTAVLFANHFLTKHGGGLLVIPVELIEEYKTLLLEYYENHRTKAKLIEFLVKKCHRGLK